MNAAAGSITISCHYNRKGYVEGTARTLRKTFLFNPTKLRQHSARCHL